jgi:23S rRNA (pseudouridine1915-N3)-methyltransferase
MKIQVLAIGTKMPGWVQQGCDEYLRRLPKEFAVELKELALANRSKSTSTQAVVQTESDKLMAAVTPGYRVIALDKSGKSWSTKQLAEQLSNWQLQSRSVALLIGGPDGLSSSCIEAADGVWSLSALTLPHPLVRIVLFEQLYRVWSLLHNHPYHK